MNTSKLFVGFHICFHICSTFAVATDDIDVDDIDGTAREQMTAWVWYLSTPLDEIKQEELW